MDYSPRGFFVHGMLQQEYWSRLSFPTPGDLPDPGVEPESPASPAVVVYVSVNPKLRICHSPANFLFGSHKFSVCAFLFCKLVHLYHFLGFIYK